MEILECCDFEFLLRLLQGIQRFLGDKCEILVHDFRKGYDHTITHEFNAKLSKRAVGGSPRGGMIANTGKDIEQFKDSMIFFYPGEKGQMFKSCTTLIADQERRIVGSICVNLDVSDFLLAQSALSNFIRYHDQQENEGEESETAPVDVATRNIDEFMNYYIRQSELIAGKPMSLMTKQEKIQALAYLDEKGVFKITKASNLLCESFKISRYTLYAYLEEAKKRNQAAEEENE